MVTDRFQGESTGVVLVTLNGNPEETLTNHQVYELIDFLKMMVRTN